MLTSNAKHIFCDNVTCFRTNKCCSNRSHLPQCCIKAPHFLLARVLCYLWNIQGSSIYTRFWQAMFATRAIALAVTIHTLPWKGLKNAPFLFLVWYPPWFFSFSGMVWRLPFCEMCQHKNSVKQAGTSHWNKLGLMYLPPAHMNITHLTTIRPNMQEWRKQGHFVWCGVFLQCSEIENDCFEIFQSQFRNTRISPFEFLSCTACWSKKQGAGIAGMLTSNAKHIFCDNVTCFRTNKCCSNRSHLPQCCIKAPHFLLARVLCFFTEHPRFFYVFLGGDICHTAVTVHT